jgi:glycerate-2-kinase
LNAVTALSSAAGEAARLGATLTVIHVQTLDSRSPMSAALDLVRAGFPGVTLRAREVVGTAGEVLINAAATAEVLFIGGPAAATGLGAVSFDVLLNISAPTILVPMQRETASADAP